MYYSDQSEFLAAVAFAAAGQIMVPRQKWKVVGLVVVAAAAAAVVVVAVVVAAGYRRSQMHLAAY